MGKQLSVIGDGDSALWIAAMMHERYRHPSIAILSNGEPLTPSGELAAVAEAYNFRIYNSAIVEVLGDPKGAGLSGFRLEDGTHVDTDNCIISLGTIVYSQLLKELGGELNASERVVVDGKYETSIPGVFAVGDLVAGKKLQIYTAWDEAVDAADEINRRLRAAYRARALAASRAAAG